MKNPESWKPEDSLATRLGEILLEARSQSTPEARDRYLERACGNDPAPRAQVVSLLEAEAAADDFLGQTALGDLNELEAEGPGTRIGPYTLVERIGEGGFGSVYVAEQEKPIQRRVALKIIKLGMDTRQGHSHALVGRVGQQALDSRLPRQQSVAVGRECRWQNHGVQRMESPPRVWGRSARMAASSQPEALRTGSSSGPPPPVNPLGNPWCTAPICRA